MKNIDIKARDKEVHAPASERSLFDIKSQYVVSGQLESQAADELFKLVDYIIDRLLVTESERFRSNY